MAARGGAISGFAWRITRSATSRFWSPGRVRSTLSWFPGPSVRSTSRTLADTLGFRRSKAGSWCRILRDARNLWRGHSCPRKACSEGGLGVGTDRGQTQKQSQKQKQRQKPKGKATAADRSVRSTRASDFLAPAQPSAISPELV